MFYFFLYLSGFILSLFLLKKSNEKRYNGWKQFSIYTSLFFSIFSWFFIAVVCLIYCFILLDKGMNSIYSFFSLRKTPFSEWWIKPLS